MDQSVLMTLCGTGMLIGFVHTLAGPDHYVPFIAMAKVGRWSWRKTILITLLCGIAHVASSVILGTLGIGLGIAVDKLEWFEGFRGGMAGWLLLGFGLAYMIWGIGRAIKNQPHTHWHAHAGGIVHNHEHAHTQEHCHLHESDNPQAKMTPWVLFTIFAFGPCEPLIPLLMFPAAQHSVWGTFVVTLVFGAVTLVTMLAMVLLGCWGLGRLNLPRLARYSHASAGFALTACGLAIQLGL